MMGKVKEDSMGGGGVLAPLKVFVKDSWWWKLLSRTRVSSSLPAYKAAVSAPGVWLKSHLQQKGNELRDGELSTLRL